MAIQSMNEMYKNDKLQYFCNACGDINIPGDDPWECHNVEELPPVEKELYLNYWDELGNFHRYVVQYNGNPAMLITILYDEGWLEDIMVDADANGVELDITMDDMLQAIKKYANILNASGKINGCDILIGDKTDPAGHEIGILVPFEMRDNIRDIDALLAKSVDLNPYRVVRKLLENPVQDDC